MRRARHAYTAIEMAIVLLALGVLAAASVMSFRGGDIQATDRAAQVNADAGLDAVVAALGRGGGLPASIDETSVNERLAAAVTEIDFVTGAVVADSPSEVSWGYDPATRSVGVAAYADNGACWLQRHTAEPTTANPRRRIYTIVLDAGPLPCTGTSALGTAAALPAVDEGTSWANPVVIGSGS